MIMTKEVDVRARSRNKKHFENLGYKIPIEKDDRGRIRTPKDATIRVKVEDLPECSNVLVQYKCDDCGEINTVQYNTIKYRKNSQYLKTGETVCNKCANHRMSGKNSGRYIHGNSRYSEYRNNAKSRGLDFALTIDEFNQLTTMPCHYCGGYSLEWNISSRGNGIDRKNSNIGYYYENCVPCCSKCNFIKNNMPYDKFIMHIRRIYETTKNFSVSE